MRRNGLETRYACGRVRAGRKARRRHDEKEEPVAAFSTIELEGVSCKGQCGIDSRPTDQLLR